MADIEQALVAKWDDMQQAAHVQDSDRQQMFSDAAGFLQSTDHWWCQHTPLTEHFAEILVYHTQPVVLRLWSTMSKQLSTCALCVVNYHAAQVGDISQTGTEYAAGSTFITLNACMI